jgi:hypothetical protein
MKNSNMCQLFSGEFSFLSNNNIESPAKFIFCGYYEPAFILEEESHLLFSNFFSHNEKKMEKFPFFRKGKRKTEQKRKSVFLLAPKSKTNESILSFESH